MTTDPYGTLGVGYATRRRTDPRVAVLIDRALVGCASVVTVVATLSELSGPVEVVPIPVPSGCVDGFLAAHWQRPHAYLDPAVRAAVSGLAALPAAVLGRGLRRLADDVAGGRWHERYADLQALGELDVGYRLVVAGH
ncbi:MAG: hypothetical protein L0H64_13670 [Pseudonocardia sp.]|nr:hypothetical protein [Pseudonocardia sp.]